MSWPSETSFCNDRSAQPPWRIVQIDSLGRSFTAEAQRQVSKGESMPKISVSKLWFGDIQSARSSQDSFHLMISACSFFFFLIGRNSTLCGDRGIIPSFLETDSERSEEDPGQRFSPLLSAIVMQPLPGPRRCRGCMLSSLHYTNITPAAPVAGNKHFPVLDRRRQSPCMARRPHTRTGRLFCPNLHQSPVNKKKMPSAKARLTGDHPISTGPWRSWSRESG